MTKPANQKHNIEENICDLNDPKRNIRLDNFNEKRHHVRSCGQMKRSEA